jgi:membrane-associated phospholipid phosphatase
MDTLSRLPGSFWDDGVALATAPADWSGRQWSEAALGAAAVLGVGLALDHSVDRAVVRNHRNAWDTPAKDVAQLGGTGGLLLIGGGYLATSALHMDEGRALWVDAGIATALSQIAILPVKYGLGRVRPAEDQGTHEFKPFTSGNDAFPSGHSAQAFAIASAVSMHADNPWVGAGAYGLAGLVALSRLETRDHFSSDVLAGAMVGTVIGRSVVAMDQQRRQSGDGKVSWQFSPVLDGKSRGLCLVARF